MTVETAVFDNRTGAGRALQYRLAELARDVGYQPEAVVPIGTLAGLQVEAHAMRCSSGIELTVRCQGVPYTSVKQRVDALNDDSRAVGLVTRLENRINALDQRRDELHGEAQRLDVEITRARGRIGAEFPQSGELSAAKLRAADIEARLTEAAHHHPSVGDQAEDRDHSRTADVEAFAAAADVDGFDASTAWGPG